MQVIIGEEAGGGQDIVNEEAGGEQGIVDLANSFDKAFEAIAYVAIQKGFIRKQENDALLESIENLLESNKNRENLNSPIVFVISTLMLLSSYLYDEIYSHIHIPVRILPSDFNEKVFNKILNLRREYNKVRNPLLLFSKFTENPPDKVDMKLLLGDMLRSSL